MSKLTFENILDRDGILVYKTKGVSMRPLLRQDRDLVVIEKKIRRQGLNVLMLRFIKEESSMFFTG